MKSAPLKNDPRSYLLVFVLGLLAGVATRLTDLFREDTLWSFSSIATLYGFWILCVAVIVLCSSSNLCAGVSSFLYLFGMTLSFYGLQYLLGLWWPAFDNGGFKTSLFLLYSVLSAAAGLGAFLLYFWERGGALGAVLYALPVGALLAETIGTGVFLLCRATFLFQFLLDGASAVILGRIFFKRTESRAVYCVAVCLAAAAVYLAVYRPSLPV